MSPSGIFAVLAMPIVGRLIGLKMDARWLIAVGLLLMTAGNYWMSQLNLDISPGQVVWPRVLLVAGLSVCFAPANVAAYLYTPLALRGAAIGLLSLLRNEGGSVGVSLSQTFQERRDQFHALRLGELLDPFNRPPAASSRGLRSSSFNRTAIRLPPNNWLGSSRICVSSRRLRSLISTPLDDGRVDLRGRVRGLVYEAFGGRERQSCGFRMMDCAPRGRGAAPPKAPPSGSLRTTTSGVPSDLVRGRQAGAEGRELAG